MMPPDSDHRDDANRPISRLGSFAARWGIAYLILTMLPFPLGKIPGVDSLVRSLRVDWGALVAWAGGQLLNVDATPRYNGSGDTTNHYVSLLLIALISLGTALIWTSIARASVPSGRVLDRTRAYARLFVGGTLLGYGWMKVFPLQFPEPGPDRLVVPLGDTSPMGILWTFMGAGSGYRVLAGLAEVIGGVLLFWRRTATLGALLLVFVLANVVALNFSYDVPVKLFSTHLLVLTLFILAPDARRLFDVLWRNRGASARVLDPYPIAGGWRRRLAQLGKIGLLVWLSVEPLRNHSRADGASALSPYHGVYDVISFESRTSGSAAKPWLRVGISQGRAGAIQWVDGSAERFRLYFDPKEHRILWMRIGTTAVFPFHVAEPNPGELRLDGQIEGVHVVVLLRKQSDAPLPLLGSRGFHWISDVPFNR